MENEKIIVKGKNLIILLFISLVLWVSNIMYCSLATKIQSVILAGIVIIFLALYLVIRGLALLINSERYNHERVIFTKGFMMDKLEESDLENTDILEKLCIYVVYGILSFMPIYFIAYVIRKLFTFPSRAIKNLFTWADIYLTIRSKNKK